MGHQPFFRPHRFPVVSRTLGFLGKLRCEQKAIMDEIQGIVLEDKTWIELTKVRKIAYTGVSQETIEAILV